MKKSSHKNFNNIFWPKLIYFPSIRPSNDPKRNVVDFYMPQIILKRRIRETKKKNKNKKIPGFFSLNPTPVSSIINPCDQHSLCRNWHANSTCNSVHPNFLENQPQQQLWFKRDSPSFYLSFSAYHILGHYPKMHTDKHLMTLGINIILKGF